MNRLRPVTHLGSEHLNRRLKLIGIKPRAARNSTLMDLASQLPATVLGSLVGISTIWTQNVGTRRRCAADMIIGGDALWAHLATSAQLRS